MPTSTFTVIVHEEASAVQNGKPISTSIVPFVSVLLISRGADHLIIPTPSADERERAEFGISKLPLNASLLSHYLTRAVKSCGGCGAILNPCVSTPETDRKMRLSILLTTSSTR